jgi:methionyl-tRNA formyltransferase
VTDRPPGHPASAPAHDNGPASDSAPARQAEPVRTLFFGSGAFAVPVLDALQALPGIELVAVVTTPDRPAGRHGRPEATPVARRTASLSLPLLQPASLRTTDATAVIAGIRPDLAILADYGRLVPRAVLEIPRRGFLNLHPSLLPRHRGATPIAGAILAGDDETGVTVFQMDEGLDTGPIVDRVGWPLAADATADSLEAIAARRAAELLVATLPRWLAGELAATPQDESAATLTRPFSREDGRLDPARPAAALERRVRALTPWPGTFMETAGTRLAVVRAAAVESLPGDTPGRLVADGDGLALATTEGRLRLLEVRPAGGRTMSAAELRRGRPALAGTAIIQPPRDLAQPAGSPAAPISGARGGDR